MSWWPGWNSIGATDFWNTFHFWAGIICLLLLGAFEVLSHYYGERHAELVGIAARDTDARRTPEQQEADSHHQSELSEVQRRLEETQRQQAEARKAQLPRHLRPDQKQILITALSSFPGTKVAIGSLMGDTEGTAYRDDFVDVLDKSRWALDGHIGVSVIQPPPRGVIVQMNKSEAEAGRIPLAIEPLLKALMDAKVITAEPKGKLPLSITPSNPIDRIEIIIGAKPEAQ